MAVSTESSSEKVKTTDLVTTDSAESDSEIALTDQDVSDRSDVKYSGDDEPYGFEGNTERMESDIRGKTSNISGAMVSSNAEKNVSVRDQVSRDEEAAVADGVNAEEGATTAIIVTNPFYDLSDNQRKSTIIAEPGNTASEYLAAEIELKKMQESLQDSLAHTQYISTKIDAVSNVIDDLLQRVTSISSVCEIQTQEMESISSGSKTKNVLSKMFLTISTVVLALLVAFQIYMFTSLIGIQRLQNVAGTSLLENISSLNKKMADFDKQFAKAMEKPVQQEHTQLSPAASETAGSETHGNNEVGSANVTPMIERLNRLRNGLPEKKLIRKETGDWFVYNKKGNESISDVEVIKALNEAYTKIGRSISPPVPLPPHSALCILKPDGKGGTLVVMTKEFLP